jgi:hypothetical protein
MDSLKPAVADSCITPPLPACRETISSGCLALDVALGGGYPKGRIVEVSRLQAATAHFLNCAVLLLLWHVAVRAQLL